MRPHLVLTSAILLSIAPPALAQKRGPPRPNNPIEDPNACTMLPFYGQSSSLGVCSGSCAIFGDPPCTTPAYCTQLSTTPLAGAYQAKWNAASQTFDRGVCPLDVDLSLCTRGSNAEEPSYGMVQTYREMARHPPQATFTSNAGQSGTAIADLGRGTAYYRRLLASIVEARDAAAADPAAYGCNGNLVVRGMAMVQGETDDANPAGYTARVVRFVDDFCEDVRNITGQTTCPHVSWDQTSGWLANRHALAPTAQQLLDAGLQRSNLHIVGAKGHYNPAMPSSPTGVHGWETSGASPLHFTAETHRHVGAMHGKWLFRAIHKGERWDGLRAISLTQQGRILTACFNPYEGPLTRDTTICPPHWNGRDGFEWHQDEVGSPVINAVATNPNDDRCLDFTMSAPVNDVPSGRLQAGFRGVARIGNEPENGCRAPNGTANPGTPGWTNWRDRDVAPLPDAINGANPAYNWVSVQAKAVDFGAIQAPPDTTAAHFSFDDVTEGVRFGNDPIFRTNTLTVSFWTRHTNSTDGIVVGKWPQFRIRHQSNGGAKRYYAQFGGSLSNSSAWLPYGVPEDNSWHHIVMIYDGRRSPGDRVRWLLDCVEIADREIGAIPGILPVGTTDFRIGDPIAGNPGDLKDLAVWPAVSTDETLLGVCRTPNDIRHLTPAYFIRPRCGDILPLNDGVVNLGTSMGTGTGVNTEVGDRVLVNTNFCTLPDGGVPVDAGTDGGVPDAGPPPDAGPSTTVPNALALTCDGVDDAVSFGSVDWLDGRSDALICYVIREPVTTVNQTPMGYWGGGVYQWRVFTRGGGQRWYVSPFGGPNGFRGRAARDVVVPGPHQVLCVRYDLDAPNADDRIRVFRNGSRVVTDEMDIGPGTVMTSPAGGSFSLCADADGNNKWRGTIDEVGVWYQDVPTDQTIVDTISFDASEWDCGLPNWGGGSGSTPAAKHWYRLESDFTDWMGSGPTGTASGAPAFTSTRVCSGTYRNLTSLRTNTRDAFETDSFIASPSDQNLVVCWTQKSTPLMTANVVVGQIDPRGLRGQNSWGVMQRSEGLRVYASQTPNSTDYRERLDGPMDEGVWANWCISYQLGEVDQHEKIHVFHNCDQIDLTTAVGALPNAFEYDALAKTTIGAADDGRWGWGSATSYITDLVAWREQDGEPSRPQIINDVCHVPGVQPTPNYGEIIGVPEPGCWFPLDGDLDDRMGNCRSLKPNGPTTWPSPAITPDTIP